MIDYGVKAPTATILADWLERAGLVTIEEIAPDDLAALRFQWADDVIVIDGEPPRVARAADRYVTLSYLGLIVKAPPVMSEDGETMLSPPVMSRDVHANLRLSGPDAAGMEARLKRLTYVAHRADPEDNAPATEGTEDGFRIFPLSRVATPTRAWG